MSVLLFNIINKMINCQIENEVFEFDSLEDLLKFDR
jgi:CTP:phosphocholine cytidylyltransferase-like protein